MHGHYLIKIILLYILIFSPNTDAIANSPSFEWRIGEELTYRVKWSFIRLGTLKMSIVDTVRLDGVKVNKVDFKIDSNPMLFFVNMHNTYESYIDDEMRLHKFYALERIDGVRYRTEYLFNYADSILELTMTDVKDTTRIINKTIPLTVPILDGTSMINYVRSQAHSSHSDTLYSIYSAEIGEVLINFTGEREQLELTNDQEVEALYVDGRLLIEGIAGVTGPYEGWFSDDAQRIPLRARLKVFIGAVRVELESWKNWQGTHFPEDREH